MRITGGGEEHEVEGLSTGATLRFLGLLFVLLLGAQALLYRDSFAVKPSSDDFIALHQVDRGEAEGVWTFFKTSDVADYRPLQNITFWLFGRISRQHLLLSLRILHFVSFIFYSLVAFLWICTLRFHRVGAVVAACVVFLHPTLAGPLAGLDNYTRLVVNAWVWLGAWIAYRFGARRIVAIPLVSLCFAMGLGYMEYALTLIPLAILSTAWPGGSRRVHTAWGMGVALLTVFSVYFFIRTSGMVATTAGTGFLALHPLVWIKNTAMIVAATLFFGNTVPIMQTVSLQGFARLGLNAALVFSALGYGLWTGGRSRLRLAAFLIAGFVASFFPIVFLSHVSEIYISGVTLALALLAGLSAQGWMTESRPRRYVALCLAGSQLLLAGDAIQGKVAGIVEAGDRTHLLMQRLLDHLPDDMTAGRVAIVFEKRSAVTGRGYSVFALPDDELVPQSASTYAMRWFRPDRNLRLDSLFVEDASRVDLEPYDLVFLWEDSRKTFRLIRGPAARAGPHAAARALPRRA